MRKTRLQRTTRNCNVGESRRYADCIRHKRAVSRATQGITVYVYGILSEDTRWLTQKSNLSRLLARDVHELSAEPVKKLLVRARLKTHTMS
jgi:hypothetical protein